jgi:TorA maturation chaperone TorD
LEYLYFLLANGWSDGNEDLINEAATFASDTMLPWISELQARLAVEKECRFYPLIASILTAILEVIAGFDRH